MYPELFRFQLFGIEHVIFSYGLMLVLASCAGTALMVWLARGSDVHAWDALYVALLAIVGGLVGAVLLDLAINFGQYWRQPQFPGMVYFGGLFGGAAASVTFIRRYRLPLVSLMDAAAPALALGHGLGRVGCFLGGCCYGRFTETSWAVVYRDSRAPAAQLSNAPPNALPNALLGHHPVQLYEAVGLLLISLLLFALVQRKRLSGKVFYVYLIAYGGLRLVTETFRADPERGQWLALSTSQWIAIAAIVFGLLLLLRVSTPRRASS